MSRETLNDRIKKIFDPGARMERQRLVLQALSPSLFNIAGRCQFTATVGGRLMRCGRQATFEVNEVTGLCKQHARLYTELTRVRYEVRPLKGGRVTRAKSVKKPKSVSRIEEPAVKLAKLLHESGRKAVELGLVVNKLGLPFMEWDQITPEAKSGRVLMARFLLDKRRRATLKGIFASR